MSESQNKAEKIDKKILLRKVKDIDGRRTFKGKFLAYNYLGSSGNDARAILVEQDKEQPDKVYIEVAKIIPNDTWIAEYYIILSQNEGAIIYQTEKADFMTFDYEYTPWDEDLHLDLRFWFDYQEVFVLEVNLGPQQNKQNEEG